MKTIDSAAAIAIVLASPVGMTAAQVAKVMGLTDISDEDAAGGFYRYDHPSADAIDAVEYALGDAIAARQLRGERVFGLTKFGTTASLGLAARVGWP
jgi:hypothetical protein